MAMSDQECCAVVPVCQLAVLWGLWLWHRQCRILQQGGCQRTFMNTCNLSTVGGKYAGYPGIYPGYESGSPEARNKIIEQEECTSHGDMFYSLVTHKKTHRNRLCLPPAFSSHRVLVTNVTTPGWSLLHSDGEPMTYGIVVDRTTIGC